MNKLMICLLISSLPMAAGAVEWQQYDEYFNPVFYEDPEFPTKMIDNVLTQDEILTWTALEMIWVQDRKDIKIYANDIGVSVIAATDFYIASKMIPDKATTEYNRIDEVFCSELNSREFTDKTTYEDIGDLVTQSHEVAASYYMVVRDELNQLSIDYPKEYILLTKGHSGEFHVSYNIIDHDKAAPSAWLEYHREICAMDDEGEIIVTSDEVLVEVNL